MKRMEPTVAAYLAGLMDGIAGQIGVTFRWDEAYSTVVLRGHPDVLKWLSQATGTPSEDSDPMGAYWSVNGADLLELLKQLHPYAVRKASDYVQMIKWLEDRAAKAPAAGVMPC